MVSLIDHVDPATVPVQAPNLSTRSWIESRPLLDADRTGDFATALDLGHYGRAIVLGDIAGHWAAPGEANALCDVVTLLLLRGTPLTEILRSASTVFAETFTSEATPFASLFLALADVRNGTLEYASAGHEPALLFGGEAACEHQHLPPTGPLLGVEARPVFTRRVLGLARNSVLTVVSDGITEARREAGDGLSFFGSAGVSRAVHDAFVQSRNPARAVYDAALAHAGGALSDDASVVVSAFSA
ncbi:MAG TPA: PP2C family protein-serine/threonine phosphatase [Candidatus Elarobacter sp.]|jgi:serine phosphatase RsbU (regulator of sigma subunit)